MTGFWCDAAGQTSAAPSLRNAERVPLCDTIANPDGTCIVAPVLTRVARDGEPVRYTSSLLTAAGVRHAFSTRIGGVSPPPFDSLNLGNPAGDMQDEWSRIYENYRRLQSAIFCPSLDRLWVHQVHGAGVTVARRDADFECGRRADAIVCDDPTRLAAVRTADCLPVLIATTDGGVVAAVHAGWRGVIAGVVPAAILAMQSIRSMQPASLLAAIGPGIGPDAFEVGPEVVGAFQARFPGKPFVRPRGDGSRSTIDLPAAVAWQLKEAGLTDRQIDRADLCTLTRQDEFFSHRRDRGVTGRMAAMIAAR